MISHRKLLLAPFALALLCFAHSGARADTVVFNFESTPTTPVGTGALTALVLTQSGLTATITREGGGGVKDHSFPDSRHLRALPPQAALSLERVG